jgi:hypothetical protein
VKTLDKDGTSGRKTKTSLKHTNIDTKLHYSFIAILHTTKIFP